MNPAREKLGTEGAIQSPPHIDPRTGLRFGLADRQALREIFLVLSFFAAYLVVIQVCASALHWSRLTGALAQFVPYCVVLVGVVYHGRRLARRDKQTLLMISFLGCVFIVLLLDVTKNLVPLAVVPLLGRDSGVRNDIASLATMVAVASFPAASYFLIEEVLLVKRQLDDQLVVLHEALRHVKRLQGLLPICMHCKKIRTDPETWQRIESYIMEHADVTFSHGLCPECAKKHYAGVLNRAPSENQGSSEAK